MPRQSFKSSAVINELYSQPNMEIQKTIVNRGHQVRGQKWSKPTQLGINELLLIGNCPQFIVVGSYGWKLYPRVPPHISEELRNVTGRPLLGHLEPPGTIFKVALKNGTSTFFSYDFFMEEIFFGCRLFMILELIKHCFPSRASFIFKGHLRLFWDRPDSLAVLFKSNEGFHEYNFFFRRKYGNKNME